MDILRLSTDLQAELIRLLTTQPDLSKLLNSIVARASDVLQADASSIYIVDRQAGPRGDKTATMRAAQGYQSYAVNVAHCAILSPEDVSSQPEGDEKLGLTGWVISTGRSFLARSPDDLTQHAHWLGKYDDIQMPSKDLKLATFLAVPLHNPRGQVIGALKAERLSDGRDVFSVNDQIVLETLARVAGRCIAYAEDAQQGQANAAITSWARDVIAEAVATEGELDTFLDIAVQVTASATQSDSCAVFLIDKSKETLTQRAGCGSQTLRRVIRSYKLPEAAQVADCENTKLCTSFTCRYKSDLPQEQRVGVTAWVAATGKSYHARNLEELRTHCHHLGRFDKPNYEGNQQCGAWSGVPLRVGGTIIGVLKIENVSQVGIPDERDFTPEIQQRLDVLAQDIALSIQRLQIQSPARYQVIKSAMPTILGILRGGLDVPTLVKKVVDETRKLFNARACALFLKEGYQLIQPPWAAVGYYPQQPTREGAQVRRYDLVTPDQILVTPGPEQKVGLTVWIAVKKEKFTAKSNLELVSHSHHKGTFDRFNFQKDERCESFMGIPLLLGEEGELVGVLKVETKMRQVGETTEAAYFNEQDELVFELIANSAAIAIQNARLLESRRLADRVMDQPTSNRVMSELCEFTRGRVEVVSTLDSTAEIVRSKDEAKASIIQSFAGLLEPRFNIAILDHLASHMDSPINSLLNFFAMAIRADTLDKVRALRAQYTKLLPVAALDNPDFFLYECAKFFLDTFEKVSDRLERYEQDPTLRVALQESIDLLKGAESRVEEMDLLERSVLGRIFAHWREMVEKKISEFIPVPNPYVAGLPLSPDSPVFFGRADVFRWIEDNLYSHDRKNVIVLHGSGRTGKTSILKQLQAGPAGKRLRERKEHPIFPVFIDLQAVQDPGTGLFLLGVAERVESALRERGVICPSPAETRFRKAPYRAFDSFLTKVDQLLAERAHGVLVIMLDEFEKLDTCVKVGMIGSGIFSYLRSKMQHQSSVTFILAGRQRLDKMTPEYKNAIFDVSIHKEVGFLSAQDAEHLIRDPVKPSAVIYDDRVVERIWGLTGGHPYLIQQLCQNCIDLLNQQRRGYQVTEEHLNDALERVLGPGNDAALDERWIDISEDDQMVLKTLARLSSDERPWVTFPKLSKQVSLDKDKVSKSLQELETQQLVVRDSPSDQERTQYRYRVDLLRLWVIRKSS